MKRHRHIPEQAVRRVQQGERMLNDGKDLPEVLRHLAVTESTKSWSEVQSWGET
jgi:hypothetical protein